MTEERKAGKSSLRARPLDDDGAIEFLPVVEVDKNGRTLDDCVADVKRAREIIRERTGFKPNAAVLPFAFIASHNLALADALEKEFGPLDGMAAILITNKSARPLFTNSDWPF